MRTDEDDEDGGDVHDGLVSCHFHFAPHLEAPANDEIII
jgi:hypothetical protein